MLDLYQSSLDLNDLPAETLSGEVAVEGVHHGEVFTRRWIVELILDLVGYTPDRDLAAMRIVEPACGLGAFLKPIVERLCHSCRRHARSLLDARDAVCGLDLLTRNINASRRLVEDLLVSRGSSLEEARLLAVEWINQGDFLLRNSDAQAADFVVGNPPYVRLEHVPDERMRAYRRFCPTMTGRADIYVGFFEMGLRSLKPGGGLGFICADRWMHNQYGRRLRQFIADGFSLDVTISMHDVDAFEEQVSAYPAISVLRHTSQASAVVAEAIQGFGPGEARALSTWILRAEAEPIGSGHFRAARLPHWFSGNDAWPEGSPERLAMVEDLTDRFPPLEDSASGTKVGIGVATGADDVFVTTESTLVEEERLLPLATCP